MQYIKTLISFNPIKIADCFGGNLHANTSQYLSPLPYKYINSILKRTDHLKESRLKNGLQI